MHYRALYSMLWALGPLMLLISLSKKFARGRLSVLDFSGHGDLGMLKYHKAPTIRSLSLHPQNDKKPSRVETHGSMRMTTSRYVHGAWHPLSEPPSPDP